MIRKICDCNNCLSYGFIYFKGPVTRCSLISCFQNCINKLFHIILPSILYPIFKISNVTV